MNLQKEREAFLKWHYQAYLLENPEIDMQNAQYIYDYAHKNALSAQLRESHFAAWQAAKAQAEKALLEQFEINNKLVEQIEELKAKAQAVPEGFVVVPKKSVEHWYLDEGESLWMDEPDNWLCDMDVGDVQEVEHKEYIVTESNTLYATKVWDGENQAVGSWEFFNSKDDAEKAAEYCNAMIEAREPIND